jgi:hypothetical protein
MRAGIIPLASTVLLLLSTQAYAQETAIERTSNGMDELLRSFFLARVAGQLSFVPGEYPIMSRKDPLFKAGIDRLPSTFTLLSDAGVIIDAWGHPIKLTIRDNMAILLSAGPDGKFVTIDDNVERRMSPLP